MKEFSRPKTGAQLRLLVVDDDEVDRLAIHRHLGAAGVDAAVDELESAETIVAVASAYDCILLDHALVRETGVEVVQRIREAGVATPILCVAGQDEEVGAALVAAGATDFLAKDELTPARLARRLRYAIELGRAASIRTELERQRVLMRSVLAHLPVGVAVVGADGTNVLMANPEAQEVLGVEAHRLADEAGLGAVARSTVTRAIAEDVAVDAPEPVADGDRWYRISAGPVRDAAGLLLGGVVSLADVTGEVAARRAAERHATAREELLGVVSHDLRGPLSAINVASDALRDPALIEAERDRYVDAIQRSVKRGDRLLRDLIDASLIEAGRLTVAAYPVSVSELLHAAAAENQALATQHGVSFSVAVAEGLDVVRADRERVLQALGNLVINALRHGRGTHRIELSGIRTDRGVALSVRDHGPGIPEDTRAHLFERYRQGRVRHGGAGLGLAVVLGIAEAHGGTATLTSPPDGGACFTIALPS